jgi:hypothetical protein
MTQMPLSGFVSRHCTLLIAVSPQWREETPDLQVALEKEFFYRSLP